VADGGEWGNGGGTMGLEAAERYRALQLGRGRIR